METLPLLHFKYFLTYKRWRSTKNNFAFAFVLGEKINNNYSKKTKKNSRVKEKKWPKMETAILQVISPQKIFFKM